MTNKEKNKNKLESLENTIKILYEKEGRTISYISNLLEIDRSQLSSWIKEKNLKKAQVRNLTKSTQKFIDKNKDFILSKLENLTNISEIAKELNVSKDKLYYVIKNDKQLTETKILCDNKKNRKKTSKKEEYYFENLPGEVWKEVLGYPKYYVSNKGRFKKYLHTYDCFALLTCTPNSRNGRLYISMINEEGKRKNLMAARIVGHAFCEGYSELNNTIDHKDNNILNNESSNLQWVSQKVNNKRAYNRGRKAVISYSKNGKFKKIILDDTFEFKTIKSLAKFLGVSESQTSRYISGECKCSHNIVLIY